MFVPVLLRPNCSFIMMRPLLHFFALPLAAYQLPTIFSTMWVFFFLANHGWYTRMSSDNDTIENDLQVVFQNSQHSKRNGTMIHFITTRGIYMQTHYPVVFYNATQNALGRVFVWMLYLLLVGLLWYPTVVATCVNDNPFSLVTTT
jgi:hypothetical protein